MSCLADVMKEYEKDPKLKKEDVNNLKIWSEKQPHLPKISELQHILFLQSCYYSNEQAKIAIENFFTLRTICKDIFADFNPHESGVQMVFDVLSIAILPKLAPSGYKVTYTKFIDLNPDKFIFLNVIKAADAIMTLHMHLQGTNDGYHIVFDGDGATLTHLLKISPTLAKKFLFYVQEAMPIRLRDVHIINAPSWIDKALAFFKPFLKKELYDMINIHSTLEDYYKVVPLDMMPGSYGGNAGSLDEMSTNTRKLLERNVKFFEGLGKQTVDESKRAEKSTDFNKIFGLEGSFKKLEVD